MILAFVYGLIPRATDWGSGEFRPCGVLNMLGYANTTGLRHTCCCSSPSRSSSFPTAEGNGKDRYLHAEHITYLIEPRFCSNTNR